MAVGAGTHGRVYSLSTAISIFGLCTSVLWGIPQGIAAENDAYFVPPDNARPLGALVFEGTPVSKEFSVGLLPADESQIFAVHIENRSSVQVPLANVKTSCGCMMAVPLDTSIEPGGRKAVYLALTPSGSRNFRTTASVVFGSAESDRLTLVLRGEVKPRFVVSPEIAEVSGKDKPTRIQVRHNFGKLREPPLVSAGDPLIQNISDVKLTDDGESISMSLQVAFAEKTTAPPAQSSVLHLVAEGKEYDVPIQLRDASRVSIHPTVLLGQKNSDGRLRFRFILTGGKDTIRDIAQDDEIGFKPDPRATATILPAESTIRRVAERTLVCELVFSEESLKDLSSEHSPRVLLWRSERSMPVGEVGLFLQQSQ